MKLFIVSALCIASSLYPARTSSGHKKKTIDHLFLNGPIDDDSASAMVESITASEADVILIEFNTPGGSVDSGFKISKAIEGSRVQVVCVVDDMAASMGFYILQSCPTRIMTRRSRLMAHQPSVGGQISSSQPDRWNNLSAMIKAVSDAMAEWCGHRLKGGPSEYRRQTNNGRDWWMTWQEAMKYRAVDMTVSTPSEASDWILRS